MRTSLSSRAARAGLLLLATLAPAGAGPNQPAKDAAWPRFAGPQPLTYSDLAALSVAARPEGPLGEKLEQVLTLPTISNEAFYAGAQPRRPYHEHLGPFLRLALWNIERGHELDWVRLAFADPEEFRRRLPGPEPADLKRELDLLQLADVVVLLEADQGMTRTGYRDVAAELAEALQMNYAFGTEFVEVDPLNLGREEIRLEDDPEAEAELRRAFAVDRSRYRGLHGTAVLSRYPIRSARLRRLSVCHDWYSKELAGPSPLERGRRLAGTLLFLSRLSREVRHGGRMALAVDLAVPGLPGETLTVVAAHLENRSTPDCRRRQMEEVLAWIHELPGPVVLAGDLNTSGGDYTPTSVRRELLRRIRSPKFWANRAIAWFNPAEWPRTLLVPANYLRSYRDPTRHNVPLLIPNRERGLFQTLEKFRFADGGAFDFRGDPRRSAGGRGGTLANSNQRARKGFRATFAFQRRYGALAGEMKLDWILVKGLLTGPRDKHGPYRLAPHFGCTLAQLNRAVPGRISDHHPMTVDLPFEEPQLPD